MNKVPRFPIFLLFISMFAANCSRQDANSQTADRGAANNSNSEKSVQTKDDAEGLAMIVNLPFEPEEVVWREDKTTASAAKLTAILRFKTDDGAKIVAQAQSYNAPTVAEFGAESWFPAELIAQSQLSGDETIKGTTYAARDFFQPPYADGKLTRVQDSNYFVLELYSR